ncbi:MAG TPA: hypothetical protein VFE47_14495 [Tepidisphaeraceae bacterium]|nr:hypothetical protein [Tepidisphaeraceae bacterium]
MTTETTQTPGEIWQGFGGPDMVLQGYVVTERGNRDRVIAYSYVSGQGAKRAEDAAKCLIDCLRVAADPASANDGGQVIDLRVCGRLDSARRMPGDIYEWVLTPLGAGSPADEDQPTDDMVGRVVENLVRIAHDPSAMPAEEMNYLLRPTTGQGAMWWVEWIRQQTGK